MNNNNNTPPTQPLPDIDPEDDYMEEDSGEDFLGESPDLGWYLGHWDMSDLAKIGICRTFANYLSARIPKTVEAKPARFSGKKIKK